MNVALPQDPVPIRPVNQVRVIIPHDVAYNLEKLQKVMASVLGRLGCQGCTSGFDIRFIQERDFLVNAKTLGVEPINPMGLG